MIRVLHVLGGLGSGGAESLIMNWYRNIDRTKVQFDFLVRSSDKNYVDEIKELGGNVYYTSSFPRHFLKNKKETEAIFAQKKWDVIHVHANAMIYFLPLKLAKKYKYKKIIMHSHSVSAQKSLYGLIHSFNSKRLKAYTDYRLACSELSGKWMFGDTSYTVLRNAINIQNFRYDEEKRKEIRKKYGFNEKFVVGNVGRFSIPKNHVRILNIFSKLKEKREDAVLLLVGDGELEDDIRKQADELGLTDSIVFAGRQSDVGAFLSAMDVFLFPSLWEGLGIVLVEAQTNGLKCISSSQATVEEIEITPLLHKVSLDESDEKWISELNNLTPEKTKRENAFFEVRNNGYDIDDVIKKLEDIYLSQEKR